MISDVWSSKIYLQNVSHVYLFVLHIPGWCTSCINKFACVKFFNSSVRYAQNWSVLLNRSLRTPNNISNVFNVSHIGIKDFWLKHFVSHTSSYTISVSTSTYYIMRRNPIYNNFKQHDVPQTVTYFSCYLCSQPNFCTYDLANLSSSCII